MGKIFGTQQITIFLLVIISYPGFSQSVSLPASTIDVLHYVFNVTVHDNSNEIKGDASIFAKLPPNQASPLILHLAGLDSSGTRGMVIDEVLFNNKPVTFTHKNHVLYLNIPVADRLIAEGTFRVKYHGIPSDGLIIKQNQYGDRTFFGDNWPNRAHFWLPTHDHPSDKATCEFVVTAPAHYQVISNGKLLEESYLLPDSQNPLRYKLSHWAITQPIPTKVMVFGAARFAVQYPPNDQPVTIENWLYPEDKEVGFQKFTPTANILLFYESILGSYPYHKIANVQSKTQYGGMENATAIFYNESVIVDQPSIEGLIAHEVAHQWFGNAVSEKNWSDVWLSEGFSTYLTHLYFEHTYGRDSMNVRLLADKERIFTYHLKSPQARVVDTDESNLFQLLNANTYQKGAWVLHMLRAKVGDKIFFTILKQFFNRYKHQNASTEDFIALASQQANSDLSAFFSQWLYRSDYPVLESSWKSSGKKLKVKVKQTQTGKPYAFPLQIGVYYANGSASEVKSVYIDELDEAFTLNVNSRVDRIVLDPATWLLHDTPLIKN
ncbi:M1 family metallopeptidase [Tunicatimonas pelagia]|uniref:M1 family metallopeptidase n=1 Tax=Tunicatimonas pelagia TaxID=931531 RepID=UPI002666CA5E|nr:M1 family metallopeptidase [Tunicatimonas pelagia]WKN43236.1 M1 family metallopeptidase [Tunicatimonas pelagia]